MYNTIQYYDIILNYYSPYYGPCKKQQHQKVHCSPITLPWYQRSLSSVDECVMFVCWFLRGGASLLLTSPALHERTPYSSSSPLTSHFRIPRSSRSGIRCNASRSSRSTRDLGLTSERDSIRSPRDPSQVRARLLSTSARVRVRTLRFPRGRVWKPSGLPS